jgi:putative FmdB family regulatory protein
MPTYDYLCMKCRHAFEAFHNMTAAPLTSCPKCKGKVKKQFGTGAGFIFKGAPVSETDYRLTSSYKEGASKDKSADSSSASTSATSEKSESKAKPEKSKPKSEKSKKAK